MSSTTANTTQHQQHPSDDFDVLTISEHPLTLVEAQKRAAAVSKQLGEKVDVPAAFVVNKAFKAISMEEFEAIKRDTTPIEFASAAAADAPNIRYRLSVQLVGTSHYSRVVVVPSALKLSQLHDRVLLPLFGVPRRTPPMAFFFAPLSPIARFAAPSASRKGAKSAVPHYLRFPVAAGNSALTAADLALFGIDSLFKADSRSLAQLGLVGGDQLAYVASPLDQGLFFHIRVVDLVKSATPDSTVTLESGSGGCLFSIPSTRTNSIEQSNSVTSLHQRHTDGHFPAVAITRTIVKALVDKTDLPTLGGGADTLLGAFLESDEIVDHCLLQSFNLAFWRRQLNLHMMLSYPIEPDETFLNKQQSLKVTRMPNVPKPYVCARCSANIPNTSNVCMCGDCGLLWYCGVECQRQHWGLHSHFCCRLMEMGAAELARNFGPTEKVVGYSIHHSAHWVRQGSGAPQMIIAPLNVVATTAPTTPMTNAPATNITVAAPATATSAPPAAKGGKAKRGGKKK